MSVEGGAEGGVPRYEFEDSGRGEKEVSSVELEREREEGKKRERELRRTLHRTKSTKGSCTLAGSPIHQSTSS